MQAQTQIDKQVDKNKYLINKYLINKYLINKYLINKYLINKYLINKYLINKYLGKGDSRALFVSWPSVNKTIIDYKGNKISFKNNSNSLYVYMQCRLLSQMGRTCEIHNANKAHINNTD